MEKTAFSAEIHGSGGPRGAPRASQLARLRAIGRAQGVAQREIDAAETSLMGAFALADFVDAIRRAAHD